MTSLSLDSALKNATRAARDIAAAIGVSPASLSQWRKGSKPVPEERRSQLERELNQPIDWTPAKSTGESADSIAGRAESARELRPINLSMANLTDRQVRAIAGGAATATVALVTFPKQPAVALFAGLAGAALGYLIPESRDDRKDGDTCPSCGSWFSRTELQNLPRTTSGQVVCTHCGGY